MIKPLDPKSVASVVRYGTLRFPMNHEAKGYSLVYNQLYPFEGLQNYTSGIIHHVRLTGTVIMIFCFHFITYLTNLYPISSMFDLSFSANNMKILYHV